jgi:hypothetical protein
VSPSSDYFGSTSSLNPSMTLASQLKQKSLSINLDRLKIAEKAKEAERIKAEKLAEKLSRLAALEIARKEREKLEQKSRQIEQKRLINWLVPGLLSAWNREDHIQYNPNSDEERATAHKYLGYAIGRSDIKFLNNDLAVLKKGITALQNRLSKLAFYTQIKIPLIEFDIYTLLNMYLNQEYIFSKVWRVKFRKEAIIFEKSAHANYAAKLRESEENARTEIAAGKVKIEQDQDIQQIINLVESLRPRIDIFRTRYWGLMNSPSSVHLINYQGIISEPINFANLVANRNYQLAVARYVLREMNIFCEITYPDAAGKFMSAFAIAAGGDFYECLEKHIADPKLLKKFDGYSRILDDGFISQNNFILPAIDGQGVSVMIEEIYSYVQKITKHFNNLDFDCLTIENGLFSMSPFISIDDLSETSIYPKVDRLAYDIQWLKSMPGQKFKRNLIQYLDEIAADGRYEAKMKIFSENDALLIELPSGKEIFCDMDWDSFDQLMNILEFRITDISSTGSLKLKWD